MLKEISFMMFSHSRGKIIETVNAVRWSVWELSKHINGFSRQTLWRECLGEHIIGGTYNCFQLKDLHEHIETVSATCILVQSGICSIERFNNGSQPVSRDPKVANLFRQSRREQDDIEMRRPNHANQ